MAVYLELYHGRNSADEQLSDWGFEGPILGPLQHVHVTYMCDVKGATVDNVDFWINCESDLVKFEGKFYGDFSVYAVEELPAHEQSRIRQITRQGNQSEAVS